MKKYIEPSIKINSVELQSLIANSPVLGMNSGEGYGEDAASGHRGGDFWSGVWSDGEE